MLERLSALRKRPALVECGIAAAVFALALAVRLPNLMLVPVYTDESFEVLWGFDIVRGLHFPLSAVDAYDGPLFSYLIALAFSIFGASAELARLLVAIFGAGTVVLVYALARAMRDRLTGCIAAALALSAPILIVFQSHQGWSSSLTPFFVCLTGFTLYLGVERENQAWLAASGLFAGLTLQTHPTSAVILLGMLVWLLAQPRLGIRLRQPGLYVALALFLLAYSPMIIANARLDPPILTTAAERNYAFAPSLSPIEYFRRLWVLVRGASYFVGGGIGAVTPLLRAQAIIVELFWLAALVWAWMRKERMVPLITITALISLPLFISSDAYRYYFALIPLAEVVIALFFVAVVVWLRAGKTHLRLRRAFGSTAILGLMLFVFNALISTALYYRDEIAGGWTNQSYFDLARVARVACGSRLFVEEGELETQIVAEQSVRMAMDNLRYLLTVSQCNYQSVRRQNLEAALAAEPDAWVVLSPPDAPATKAFDLQTIASGAVPWPYQFFVPLALYRVSLRP